MLTSILSDFLVNFEDRESVVWPPDDDWVDSAYLFADRALIVAKRIVKENEEVGLYDR